ncbi:MAG: EutN/CcmL family microcompartment protein [Xenococcaceae cyanobacterium MO_188.B19]|nr:EutN/CcmL family microcompartment protein [Xenococcaceae cyanobacterium MO_188.B19]
MKIAQVLGTVVSTHKSPNMTGVKLLLVQFIDESGQLLPEYEVAADMVGAGINEWVLVSRGSAARIENRYEERPLDATIVGIIDTISIGNRSLYSKRETERLS